MTEQHDNGSTALAERAEQSHDLTRISDEAMPMVIQSQASLMMNPQMFEHMQRVCKVYAASDVVPAQFRNNLPNCMIAFEIAHRMQANVFMLMQNMYVIQGKPGLEAKLVIGLVNMRGPFRGTIQYAFKRHDNGKPIACTAWAIHKATGERCEATVTWDIVEKEGWAKKSGSKWLTMPEQMFMYRSAAWLARAYCPEVILGMHTADELQDTYMDVRYVESTATSKSKTAALADKLAGTAKGDRFYREPEANQAETPPHVEADKTDGEPQPGPADQTDEDGHPTPDPASAEEPAGDAPETPDSEAKATDAGDGKANDGGLSAADRIIETMVAVHDCTYHHAKEAVNAYVKKFKWADTIHDLDDEAKLNDIAAKVKDGTIKIK